MTHHATNSEAATKRVPHLRDVSIVAKMGIGQSPTFPEKSKLSSFSWTSVKTIDSIECVLSIALEVAPLWCILVACLFLGSPLQAQPAKSNGKVPGATTYALTKELLAVAPKRFYGSPGHAAAEKFITSHFAPEEKDHRLEIDSFTATTPAGLQSLRNIIVKFPSATQGKKDGIIVLGSHYETNYPLKDINFVGANDGACTSSLLIAFGEYFRAHPPQGYSVYLVFFDGEEAVKEWDANHDALYGSRHLAAKWSQDGTLGKIKALILADMIGDKNLDIDLDGNSDPHMVELLKEAARNTGHMAALSKDTTPIEDDTLPFHKRGVPVLDVIDYNYGPHDQKHSDGYHHTAEDTIDKISPQSLQTAADLFLELIALVNQH